MPKVMRQFSNYLKRAHNHCYSRSTSTGQKDKKFESNVELSSKESQAKESANKYRAKAKTTSGYTEDSPAQNLRYINYKQKDAPK